MEVRREEEKKVYHHVKSWYEESGRWGGGELRDCISYAREGVRTRLFALQRYRNRRVTLMRS